MKKYYVTKWKLISQLMKDKNRIVLHNYLHHNRSVFCACSFWFVNINKTLNKWFTEICVKIIPAWMAVRSAIMHGHTDFNMSMKQLIHLQNHYLLKKHLDLLMHISISQICAILNCLLLLDKHLILSESLVYSFIPK